MSSPELALWQRAEDAAANERWDEARQGYQRLSAHPDWVVPAQLRLSGLAQLQGRLTEAAEAILVAAAGVQDEAPLAVAVIRQAFDLGEIEAGLRVAVDPVIARSTQPEILVEAARLLCDQSLPEPALPLLEAAAGAGARTPELFHLLGVARMFAGDLAAAESAFEFCLRLNRDEVSAHYLLSGLARQRPGRDHVDRLRATLDRLGPQHAGTPLIHYALFKELDDLGQDEAAWSALAEGMVRRRRQVDHDPEADSALFSQLHEVVPGEDDARSQPSGPCPIFIVGMPRSGTTLLERILGSHPQVSDAGELRDFGFQARCLTGCLGGLDTDVALARALQGWRDWGRLGRQYLSHTQWRARGRAFYTDKMPVNYLNLGWIAKALPHAKFLHMVRDPMDVCFSNLKQLFAPGNAHSFDLLEMADHFVRYRALMAHWHDAFPGRVLDVEYDALVHEPAVVAQRVLAFCGLPWDPSVVAIESRQGVVATASMVQVREGIHQRYVGQWRRYATQLEPMRARLAVAGL
ncbi:MAG: sulfotransferase [Burkholderiaceae bacterium]|nr:sulfotransferase [Rhodoferax sp.]MCP5270141.1 sulfotransferase [Burkholderiaceae bacterium]